jgi:hypothetical protein
VLAEVSNYASEENLRAALLAVLQEHAEWGQPSEEEKRIARSGSPVERANVLFDLGREEAARRVLIRETGAEESLLLGHFGRLAKDWDAMEEALARVPMGAFRDDVLVERGWRRLARGDLATLASDLAAIGASSPRASEARYLAGLARWRERRDDEALAIWKDSIESCSQDPWIYRADWAYTSVKQGARLEFAQNAPRCSPLGRIGYMGRSPPDLERDGPD